MNELLAFGFAKIAVALVCLVFASWHDLKCRTVPNKIWAFFGPTVAALSLVEYVFFAPNLLTLYAVTGSLIMFVSFACYYFNVFGGADLKCLVCLALAFPVGVVFTLNFAFGFVAAYMMFNFIMNLGGVKPLFSRGLERETAFRRLAVLFVGKRVSVEQLRRKWWMIPLEDGAGRFIFRVKDSERDLLISKLEGTVWVSEGLPLVVFFALALGVTLLVAPFAGV